MESIKYKIEPFCGKNFATWAFRMKSILTENDCLAAIQSIEFVDKDENKKLESRAQALLIASVADSHIDYMKKNSAYLMWKSLEENFMKKSTVGTLFLRRKLSEIKYNEKKALQDHLLEIEGIFNELEGAEVKLSEEEKINYLLLSMPESYNIVISSLETQSEITYIFAKRRLLAEDERRQGQNKKADTNPQAAFNCYTCGKPGHKKFQCRINRGRGYHASRGQGRQDNIGQGDTGQGNYNRPQENTRQGYDTRQRGRGSNWRNGYRRGNGYGNRGDNWTRGQSDANLAGNNTVQNNAFLSYGQQGNISNNNYKIEFCVDSGCTDHLINTKEHFENYLELKIPIKIAAAKNGINLEAIGVGNLQVKSRVGTKENECYLSNVLYVPELRKNLLSVSKMESAGMKVVFNQGKVRVYTQDNLLLIGDKHKTLYTVHLETNGKTCNFTCKTKEDEIELWHRRFGHLGNANLNLLVKKNMVDGLSGLKNKTIENDLCEPCVLGKHCRQPFNKLGYRARRPLELVHTDVCGPISPSTYDDKNYFVTFIDDYTHFTMVYLMRNKSEVFDNFKHYYYLVTNHFNINLYKLRLDNGREYLSNDFKDFCNRNGIVMQHTVAYNPEMNGVAERMNRTLMDKARTMLIDSEMKKEFWGEAVLFSAYVTNRSPVTGREQTPSELWENRKPDVSNLRIFGCAAYNHVPKELRKKLDDKGKKMIMIGYAIGGYKLYDEETGSVVIARNVVFDERRKNTEKNIYLPGYDDQEDTGKSEKELRNKKNEESIEEIEHERNLNEEKKFSNQEKVRSIEKEDTAEIEKGNSESQETGRVRRQSKKPTWQEDYVMNFEDEIDAFYALFCDEDNIPHTYEEIKGREDEKEWMIAVREELKVLKESETFEVTQRPEDHKILDAKWIFTKKITGTDSICKARLVVRGFQQEGQFEDIYSPVLRMQTLRTLLSVAANKDYHISQMDVKGAFLYGRIDEEVYLKPPEGMNIKSGLVLKLKKSLYGLKKSPKYWYEKFNETITSYGFIRSNNDYCLYTKGELYLLLYVDDLLIFGSSLRDIDNVKCFLRTKFRMKDLGNDNLMYLGISIKRTSEGISIDQSNYLFNILKRFHMQDCKGCDTPMDANFKYDENSEIDLSLEKQCRSLIGSLMYATIGSRPDLAASVYYLSRFQSKPSADLWRSLKRLLRYVKKTVNVSLLYTKTNSSMPLLAYADADFARDSDRKSTSGYLIKVFNNTVVWKSRKQNTVALSTTEAEFVALCECIMETCWMIKLLVDLNIKVDNVVIFEDNQSTIKAIKNPDQKRLKHVDVKYNFIKQKVEENLITVKYINTKRQFADILTKPVTKSIFNSLCEGLNLCIGKACVEEEC